MSLRDDLAGVLARDARYSIHAYAFVFEALEHTKLLRKRNRARGRGRRPRGGDRAQHVTGRELCEGARDLALRQYGLLARAVLAQWGIRSTSDLGNIVYNLIASGDLEKTPADSRTDFDNVFDLDDALRHDYTMALDDVA
jgi:uncharacterized repeat protein (TIGR04138 family)